MIKLVLTNYALSAHNLNKHNSLQMIP